MQAYSYDPVTKIFSGVISCQQSPLEQGVYLLPANSTLVAPPALPVGSVAVFYNGYWDIFPDFRGEKLYFQADSRITETVTSVANPVDITWTLTPPPDNVKHYVMVDGAWQEYQKTPSELLAEYDSAMENYLKETRIQRGYTTREPSDYVSSSVTRWHQDAVDWIAFRDSVLMYALDVENAVSAGGVLPTLEGFIENMPVIAWTNE